MGKKDIYESKNDSKLKDWNNKMMEEDLDCII